MNDEKRAAYIAAFEKAAADLGALRDLVFADDMLEGGGTVPIATTYNQRNPLWAAAKLGTSSKSTIGGYGCLISSVASMLTDAGAVMNPLQLNQWLNANGGFSGGTQFVFASVDKTNVVKFYNIIECANIPAPIDQLDAFVNQGDFVIVKVNNGIPPDFHWGRYIGGGKMIDPLHGDIAPITPRYKGKDAAECILRAVFYKKV